MIAFLLFFFFAFERTSILKTVLLESYFDCYNNYYAADGDTRSSHYKHASSKFALIRTSPVTEDILSTHIGARAYTCTPICTLR